MEMRLDAAKSAVRYEKPALSSAHSKVEDKRQYVARIPHPSANPEEWLTQYGGMKDEDQASPAPGVLIALKAKGPPRRTAPI